MLICAAGDIHGAMDRLYRDVLDFEASLGVRFDYAYPLLRPSQECEGLLSSFSTPRRPALPPSPPPRSTGQRWARQA